MAAPKKNTVDWEKVEREYRLGELTVREIADKHDINPTSLTRRAKKFNWTRDLTTAVRAVTKAKDTAKRRAEHEAKLLSEAQKSTQAHEESTQKSTQEQILVGAQRVASAVDCIAEDNADILSEHRAELREMRAGAVALMREIKEQSATPQETLTAIAKQLIEGGHEDALKALFKATAVSTRASSYKLVADAYAKTMEKERQANGIDEKGGDSDTGEGMATAVQAMS